MSIIIKTPCKINLFLDITKKREDGYHLIESLFHTVDLYDILFIEESDLFCVSTNGKYKLDDSNEINILERVYNYFVDNYNLKKKYNISISKNIPTGAGLGGGSSNAAYFIKFLLSELNIIADNSMIESFSRFGADIPFFINGGCTWSSGIGEKLFNYNFTLPYKIILIYPNIHISTKLAYGNFKSDDFDKGSFNSFKSLLENNINFDDFYSRLYNVFENNVFNLEPKIREYKENIENILNRKVCMSGSGSSLFALYKNDDISIDNDFDSLVKLYNNTLDIYNLNLI